MMVSKFPTAVTLLLLLVTFTVGNLSGAVTGAEYCGAISEFDPDFPEYVSYVLNQAVAGAPDVGADSGGYRTCSKLHPGGGGSAYANATCYPKYKDDAEGCAACLDNLQPYVAACSDHTTGAANYEDECSLNFLLVAD